ncbi:MAG: DUF1493 family protein [Chitinophagaceae bacterium]|nr:DUF1493 family protein [Chitinophagaceae bacterium]
MVPTIVKTDFATLRRAYQEVQSFVEERAWEKIEGQQTSIEEDLGMAGDDNYELMEEFVTRYQLDATGFNYSKHFCSEGELFDSTAALVTLFLTVVRVLQWIVQMISFKTIRFDNTHMRDWPRHTYDLTFGDLLTWYLAKKFTIRGEVLFVLG